MSVNVKVVVISSVAICALVAGYSILNRSLDGLLDYFLWKTFSTKAGGGSYTTVRDASLYYEIHGKGEPLLLLHGGLTSSDSFYKQLPELANHFQVIVMDSRGHGRSGGLGGEMSYAEMSNDVIALLEHLNIESVRVYGWSDGGVVGLGVALLRPDLISQMALFGSNFHHTGLIEDELSSPDFPADSELLAPMRLSYESVAPNPERWPEFVKATLTMWSTQPTFTVAQLESIELQILVMAGEHDMIKPSHLETMVKALPKATLRILPGATHFAPIDDAPRVNAELLEFFR